VSGMAISEGAASAVVAAMGSWSYEHVVVFTRSSFTVQHPLRERLDGDLFKCSLLKYCSSLPGPPTAPGRYRALKDKTRRWTFHALEQAT
jgi:hypothetical protein